MPQVVRRAAIAVAVSAALAIAPATTAAQEPPKNLRVCGNAATGSWSNDSVGYAMVQECTLTVPQAGTALVIATASAAIFGGNGGQPFEGEFRIGVDDVDGDDKHDRRVNVEKDGATGDGNDRGVAHSGVFEVGAGTHTFSSFGRRLTGTGTMRLWSPSLLVVFVPAGSRAQLCGAVLPGFRVATSPTFEVIQSCALQVTEPSTAFLFGSAGVGLGPGGASEGRFNVAVDATSDPASDRWVNVFADGADGTDRSMLTAVARPVSPGPHTFNLTAAKTGGPGGVGMHDASLAALVLPDGWDRTRQCASHSDTIWTLSAVGAIDPLASCSFTAPSSGQVATVASGSAGLGPAGETEGGYQLGLDGLGNVAASRYINVYASGGEGLDESLAASRLTDADAGPHTATLYGERFAGSLPRVWSPGVGAIWFAPPDTVAPRIIVTERPAASGTAQIAFTTDERAGTDCALDGGPLVPCGSPQAFTGLAPGGHALRIRATDEVGNQSDETVAWTTAAATTPPSPPGVALASARPARVLSRRYDRAKGELVLRAELPSPGRLAARATARRRGTAFLAQRRRVRTITVGTATSTVARAGVQTVRIKLARAARRARRVKVSYALTFTAAGQRPQVVRGALTIRQPRAPAARRS